MTGRDTRNRHSHHYQTAREAAALGLGRAWEDWARRPVGLLARNEYLVTEDRILRAQLKGRVRLSDVERAALGEIGHRLGRMVLGEVANVARPDTILAWYRKLVARKFDARAFPGSPTSLSIEQDRARHDP
jgi:hypothetical protein